MRKFMFFAVRRTVLTASFQVGLHNLRYFLLFMYVPPPRRNGTPLMIRYRGWLSLACWAVTVVGYDTLWLSLEHRPIVRSPRRPC